MQPSNNSKNNVVVHFPDCVVKNKIKETKSALPIRDESFRGYMDYYICNVESFMDRCLASPRQRMFFPKVFPTGKKKDKKCHFLYSRILSRKYSRCWRNSDYGFIQIHSTALIVIIVAVIRVTLITCRIKNVIFFCFLDN